MGAKCPVHRSGSEWLAGTQSTHHRQRGSLIARNIRWTNIGKVTRWNYCVCVPPRRNITLSVWTHCIYYLRIMLLFPFITVVSKEEHKRFDTMQRLNSPQRWACVSPSVSVKLSPRTCHVQLREAPICWERITTNLRRLCGSEHLREETLQRLATNCLSAGANSPSSSLQHLVL